MQEYDPAAYGERLADNYDALYPGDEPETAAAVDFLAQLANKHHSPSVLEFGIGTGRLAIALRDRGLRVAGIDASKSMNAQLQKKDPREEIKVEIGDYVSTVHSDGPFSVVTIVANNVLDPRGRDAQHRLFNNAAAQLEHNGFFVVEAFILGEAVRKGNWTMSPRQVTDEHVELQFIRFNVATNVVERTLVHMRPLGLDFVSVRDTYAEPDELDVMAQASNMTRMGRYADWFGTPFSLSSARHVTVYQKH